MTPLEFAGIRFDAQDVGRVAAFWSGLLGWDAEPQPGGAVLLRPLESGNYPIFVVSTEAPKAGQNRIHFDLTSASADAQQEMVERAGALGGGPVDIGQGSDELHVVLADPEGNEFCVIEPQNRFLAGTGSIGAINCDGTAAVGHFWSQALSWPLVWDQDEETAIQSPAGGSKITWSGPPLMPRHGRDRLRFVLSATDLSDAITHLGGLGASLAGQVGDEALLLDPDGNEFHLISA